MPDRHEPDIDEGLDDRVLEALAEASAIEPSTGLRDRVLADVRTEQRLASAPVAARRWRAVGAGAIAAAAALAVWVGIERSGREAAEIALHSLAAQHASQSARLAESEAALTGLRLELASQAQVVRVLSTPRILSAHLSGTESAAAQGRVVLDPGSGRVVVLGHGLPALDAERIYELWAIRGSGAPEPAGLFGAEGAGGFAASVPALERSEEITAFAISIEPAGGSAEPTGPIVLVGSVEL